MNIEAIYNVFLKSSGVSTDTRTIKKNNIFFSIKGDNFDGNKYAVQAIQKGAMLAIVDDKTLETTDKKIIYVKNSLECLQQLANYHRNKLKIPIIAITGTNGKTTTKELINAVLSTQYSVGYTKGNLNNHIGVPLTLLSFKKEMQYGVVEMGANHRYEIKNLCNIAEPDFGIITNIGKAHLEGFGSEEVLINTKKELYDYLYKNKGIVFINNDNKLLRKICNVKTISYGTEYNTGTQTKGKLTSVNPYIELEWEDTQIQTKIIGQYNFENIMAAVCTGKYFGVTKENIVSALQNYIPSDNRSQIINIGNNTILLDAYNANPSSMQQAIDSFLKIKTSKEKMLFLGDMYELGNSSGAEHLLILEKLDKSKITNIYLIGENFFIFSEKFKFKFYKNTANFITYLKTQKLENKYILIKASRGIKLEQTLDHI